MQRNLKVRRKKRSKQIGPGSFSGGGKLGGNKREEDELFERLRVPEEKGTDEGPRWAEGLERKPAILRILS